MFKYLKDPSALLTTYSTPAAAAITPPPSAEETAQIPVEPLTPEELKEMIAKSKEGEQDDDCLMCGS